MFAGALYHQRRCGAGRYFHGAATPLRCHFDLAAFLSQPGGYIFLQVIGGSPRAPSPPLTLLRRRGRFTTMRYVIYGIVTSAHGYSQGSQAEASRFRASVLPDTCPGIGFFWVSVRVALLMLCIAVAIPQSSQAPGPRPC